MAESPLSRKVLDELGRPPAYPSDPSSSAGVNSVQTHISYVFLTRERVYKFRKDVDLGFVCFGSRRERNADCLREVELNRRLAPDVYLGVAPLLLGSRRARIGPVAEQLAAPEADGCPEHCVVMRRLPEKRDALSLLERRALCAIQLDRVATAIARFHARSGLGTPTPLGSNEWLERCRRPVEESYRELLSGGGDSAYAAAASLARERADEFVRLHADRFEARRVAGRAVDAHGDLHLQHIWFEQDDSEPLMIDCLEFNRELRQIDAASEVGFTAMDLYYRGSPQLAERFLRVYARERDDFDLYSVVDYFISYRAAVRAKVAAIAASDTSVQQDRRRQAGESACKHVALALRALDRKPPGGLVLVGGVVGTGKTTVANALADELGAVVVSTDRVRKHLLGLEPGDHPGTESVSRIYTCAQKHEIYEALLSRARPVIGSGRTVVLDGTFSQGLHRLRARSLAAEAGARCFFIEIRCAPEVAIERLARRAEAGGDASDAGPERYEPSAAEFESLAAWSPRSRTVLHTDRAGWREHLSAVARRVRDELRPAAEAMG